MSANLPWLLGAAVGGWLVYEATGPHPVETRQVTVDGRVYVVRRYKGGRYEVDRVINGEPVTRVNFDQTQLISSAGDPIQLAALTADMARFPRDLFAGDELGLDLSWLESSAWYTVYDGKRWNAARYLKRNAADNWYLDTIEAVSAHVPMNRVRLYKHTGSSWQPA